VGAPKRVAIIQSNYIPWKGYFDFIASVDEFILFDGVQFTKRDWRNRNKIKTKDGSRWLTIPVLSKGKYLQLIQETEIGEGDWRGEHLNAIRHSYVRARCFEEVWPWLEGAYNKCDSHMLSDVNATLIAAVCEFLNIPTKISRSSDFELVEGKNERLIGLCSQAGATTYLSGPAARDYMDVEAFQKEGIAVEFMDYEGYPEYEQLHPPFEHGVSIVDLLMNAGRDAVGFMKCHR
jgi:WbqC-like protein family